MKTIFWKELREHARYVPLGILPMVIVFVLKWRSSELVFDASRYSGLGLSSLVGLVAAGIALCLGVLQSWPDQRPAARALLLHRGITADAAFGGKLLAGLLLYASAVFVPLLGMALFIAGVGIEYRAASPGVLLPSILISVVAFSCWPAAMLVVQRDAWIFGSRLLPGLAAVLAVSGCGISMNDVLWLALILVVVTLVGFLAAARSAFVNSNHIATRGGRASLTLMVTVSLLSLTFFVVGFLDSYRRTVMRSSAPATLLRVDLGEDGRPWLLRSSYAPYGYVVDQAAKMLPDRSVRDQLQPVGDKWTSMRSWNLSMRTYYDQESVFGGRFVQVSGPFTAGGPEPVYRTWVFDAKLDTLLVYRLGMFNRYRLEAKLTPPAAATTFGILHNLDTNDEAGNFTMVTSTGVYRVPGDGSPVESVYLLPKASKFGSEFLTRTSLLPAHGRFGAQAANIGRYELVLRLDDRIVFIENNNNIEGSASPGARSLGAFRGLREVFITEARLPKELANAEQISIASDPTSDGAYVGLTRDVRGSLQVSWINFDASGQIKEQVRYDAEPYPVADVSGEMAGVALVPPAVYAFGAAMVVVEDPWAAEEMKELWKYAKQAPGQTIGLVFLGFLQPMIGIPLAFWAARRRALDKSRTRLWVCWAFWFGPCGSLTLLAIYPRIMREPCGACHRPARIDRASCEHCDHSLDETSATGIEIFDHLQTASGITAQPAST